MATLALQGSLPQSGAEQFAARMAGKVILPAEEGYDDARRAWNLTVDQRPEMVVYVESAQDAAAALEYARQAGLPVAVQATGHGVIGAANGAVLINTSRLQDVRVDPEARSAWVGGGAQWGPVLAQTQPHGLAPLLGSSSGVGAVGYTLGGGSGWLVRKYGLAADSVLRMEVVTADGAVRTASPEENSDLFWALRGGGGGFGVVTGMEIRLYPVAEVYAGNLLYPPELAGEVFRRFRAWMETAPDELTASVVLMNFPPFPSVPEPLRGKSAVMVRGCFAGPLEEGEKLLDYWRTWQPPMMDMFGPMPFSAADSISQDPVDPLPARMSGSYLADLPDQAIEALVSHTFPSDGPPVLVFSEVRAMGGAMANSGPVASACSHRDQKWVWVSIAAVMDAAMGAAVDGQLARLRAALGPGLSGKAYANFVEGDEARRRTREIFSPQDYARLQQVKARYDPENLFRHSYDIPPVG